MITKLIFTDGMEEIHEGLYPAMEPAEDLLNMCDFDNNIHHEYELKLVQEIVFINSIERKE